VQLGALLLHLTESANDLLALGATEDWPTVLDPAAVVSLAELREQHGATMYFRVVSGAVRQDLADSEPLRLSCQERRSTAVTPHKLCLNGEVEGGAADEEAAPPEQ
jgi:hypothetical protein